MYNSTVKIAVFSTDSCSGSYSFFCATDKQCISRSKRCDGVHKKDCASGEDEVDCCKKLKTSFNCMSCMK